MLSKTKIKSRLAKKTSPELKETIALAMKNPEWNHIAKLLSSSTKAQAKTNLAEIDKQVKVGDTIIVPGKILSKGELTKKISLRALKISEKAKLKLQESKSEFSTIKHEIEKNPKAQGVKIIK